MAVALIAGAYVVLIGYARQHFLQDFYKIKNNAE